MTELLCRSQIPGCEDCAAEAEYEAGRGHVCGARSPKWETMCDVTFQMRQDEAMHQRLHLPTTCENCGAVLDDHVSPFREVRGHCRSGMCVAWTCPQCGDVQSSAGPIDCWACSGYRSEPVRQMRRRYRLKRRHW